jgi:hypothetical protein
MSSAQTLGSPQTVRVETPNSGARVHGNVTFTGIALDCITAQPATRVAVYDTTTPANQYLADVSVDSLRANSDACPIPTGSNQSGFTLIMDSNRLAEGRHTLTFVAQYPNGTSQTTSTDVVVDNIANVYQYPARYNGVFYGGYTYNGVYTPVYTRCLLYNAAGLCVSYQTVNAPVVTPTVYPGCITNVYGVCVGYTNVTPYYATTYFNNLYLWNGVAWVRR